MIQDLSKLILVVSMYLFHYEEIKVIILWEKSLELRHFLGDKSKN